MKTRFIVLTLLFTASLLSCTQKAAFQGSPWDQYDNPELAGFDADKLDKLSLYINKSARTTGMVVAYKGKIIYEYGDIDKISYIASCRKSVLSMLYGKHVENGTIDLNETIGELGIDEKDGLLPIEKSATINDVITSRSGVHHVASNGGYDKESFLERGSVEPGTYFVYNNWDFNVAGEILEIKTGNSIYEEMETQLAIPLGFEDWNIENQRKSGNKKKSQYLAYHMYLSSRDMAKIGQLMLNEGEWNGKQIMSKEWIKKTTTTVTTFEEMVDRFGPADPDKAHMSYGYMWWLIDNYQGKPEFEGAYTAIGYGGQWITILPAVDMVIAHKTKLDLLTMAGISYHATEDPEYYTMINMLLEARQ